MTERLRLLLIALATVIVTSASYVVAPDVAIVAQLEPIQVCR